MRAPEPPDRRTTAAEVLRIRGEEREEASDLLVTEEPLEIRLRAGGAERTVAVTMRTPGADEELALGFLLAEGVLDGPEEVLRCEVLEDPWAEAGRPSNVLALELRRGSLPDLANLERHFFASSACGVCGKAGIANLRLRITARLPSGPAVLRRLLFSLPERLLAAQSLFAKTGGLHAAALFDAAGELLALREDVGRHNALDKLVGWASRAGRLPLCESILLVSGRASFEILQKALVAGIPIVASVSAPSSLAVDLAREFGVTLVGFLRGERCNVYAGEERLRP